MKKYKKVMNFDKKTLANHHDRLLKKNILFIADICMYVVIP